MNNKSNSKKAAAEGSVLWLIRQVVVARAVRSTFGVSALAFYDDTTFHKQRPDLRYTDAHGGDRISVWSTWVKKVSFRLTPYP